MAGATVELAGWVHATAHNPLPEHVTAHVRRLLLDFAAAAVSGVESTAAAAVRDLVEQMYPGDAATVIGGGRASAAGAALANGTAAHALDIDDGYTPGSVHPSAPTLPAVLAAAEATGADAETVLRAAACAIELTCRVARAAHPATRNAGFHNTAIAGVLGAAAGVSIVLGLDEATTASALGVAGSHAGGLFEFLGSGAEVKRLHAGKAARDGLTSAYLARAGLTGPATVLEGENGWFHAFAGDDWRPMALLDGLGTEWALLGTYVKLYPCCRHLHAAIDAVLAIREPDLGPVEEIAVETYAVAAKHDHRTVETLIDAQMSMPYCVAVALLDGEVGLVQFDGQHRASTEVRRLLPRVSVTAAADLDARYPAARPARVTLRRAGLPEVTMQVDQPLGEPSNPVDDERIAAKFRLLAEPVVGIDRSGRVLAAIEKFDDVRALMSALRENE